ncbi:MAG: UTP--glucose-phosphate uridylyltransferase [Pseudomonadota bacterium]|jgi:UTP--glucose-1-phosphate uridylyltransferase|nr:UTP--glucose-1-phosphate uridylyltransferase GalU [Burkholderiales bacterium]MBP9768355.1 UTP--glucose-1-phosphate uridylyltransferase GalU [Burkholderiales bacterium]MDQ5948120.1 UTP--glucose-phosphate uridylyltransferase [Pseudomonadota bacterium]HCY39737.1 UTP--glucose-1-phosphate uridylyltransferase [Neisseriales bacterium]
MSAKITKAVFPVAGMGTRFLPATKASPKEMLPIVDKPLIQYAVEEAIDAGITELIFITGRNKRSIEDHFDKAYELETELELKHKTKLLEIVQNILPSNVNCIYIRQAEALGLGHAVLTASSVVGNEAFAVILADELIDAKPGALAQMVEVYNQTGSSVLGVNEVNPEDVSSYGIVKLADKSLKFKKIEAIVEKPSQENAPSNLAAVGRYILTPRIFNELRNTPRGVGGEIQLTDAISEVLHYEAIFAHIIDGKRYDCGSKLGYLEATIGYGLKHPEIGEQLRDYLKQLQLEL